MLYDFQMILDFLCFGDAFEESFRNLDSVMCVISSSDSSKSYAMASITSVHSDGTFDVKFDSKFSMRSRVPVDDILPVPKQLMSLPCWLFDDVPGAGCQ